MGKTKKSKSKIVRYAVIALSVVFLISSALALLEIWEKRQGRFPEATTEDKRVQYNGEEYLLNDNIDTFLIMGLDKFEGTAAADSYNNNQQADFLMLFVFDNASRKCSAIQINRDTMAKFNVLGVAGNKIDVVTKQIALAHTYGNGRDVSCRNTAEAVSELLLGMKVNHYISLTMDSVVLFNDLVGGVEVTVSDDFTGVDDTLVKGQKVTLTGEHALSFVRSRQGLEDATNSTRMERQKQYMNALYEKTQNCIKSNSDFIVDASLKMADYIVSDRSITQLQDIGKKFSEYEFLGINSIKGESKLGESFMEFYPDETGLKELVFDLFYNKVNEAK